MRGGNSDSSLAGLNWGQKSVPVDPAARVRKAEEEWGARWKNYEPFVQYAKRGGSLPKLQVHVMDLSLIHI